MPSRRFTLPSLVLALLALAPLAARAAFPIDASVVNTLPGSYQHSSACADGSGGVFIAAIGLGVGTQVRVYHVGRDGAPVGAWPASGVVVADTTGDRLNPVIISDGGGGVFVAWDDTRVPANAKDVYLQHLDGSGAVAAGWPARGILVANSLFEESYPKLVRDGSGGVAMVYSLLFSYPDYDIYGARYTGSGVKVWWGPIETSANYETNPFVVVDHTDGLVGIAYNYKTTLGGATNDVRMTFVTLGAGVFSLRRDLCAAAGEQYLFALAEGHDDVYYAVWDDYRTGTGTLRAAGLWRTGSLTSDWPISDGLILANTGYYQNGGLSAVDAQNQLWTTLYEFRGADDDVVVQRTTTGGLAAPGFGTNGITVCSATGNQYVAGIDVDGAGEAVVAWVDRRAGSPTQSDVYATRVRPDGQLAPGFPYDGRAISTAAGAQQSPAFVVGDPLGGGYVGFSSVSDGAALQHVDRFGALGDVSPSFTSIRDVRSDQGGSVRLQWHASPLDAEPYSSISSYWVWRSTPLAAARAAAERGARVIAPGADAAAPADGERLYMLDPSGAAAIGWEYLTSLPASLLSDYSYVAATTADSSAGHNPYTLFMVEARGTTSGTFWSSPVDSGYSVDNLAPPAPAPFSGVYGGGTSTLTWGAPDAPDVVGYVLHRGGSAGFTPSPANQVASPSATAYVDAAGGPYWYKVAAVDAHGNVGAFATALPSGTLAVEGEALPTRLELALAGPNPAHGGASLALALPRAARVRLTLLDVSGRHVRTLVDGALPAGRHAVAWDGRDAAGRPAAAGLYLVKLDADRDSRLQRVVLLP